MEWYWYYLIVGVYIATISYATTIFYKLRHPEYIRVNKLFNWKMLYGFPIQVVFWWFIIVIFFYAIMGGIHNEQKLKILLKANKLKEQEGGN